MLPVAFISFRYLLETRDLDMAAFDRAAL